MKIVGLIISIIIMFLDVGTAAYLIFYLISIPGNKKLFRRLEKRKNKGNLSKIIFITLIINFIYFTIMNL